MNAPEILESILVPAGARKVTYVQDEKLLSAGTFVFEREDHTLGNLLRMQLLDDERVLFVGYRQPHPLEHKIELKVQTRDEYNPVTVVQQALRALSAESDTILRRFQTALEDKLGQKNEY